MKSPFTVRQHPRYWSTSHARQATVAQYIEWRMWMFFANGLTHILSTAFKQCMIMAATAQPGGCIIVCFVGVAEVCLTNSSALVHRVKKWLRESIYMLVNINETVQMQSNEHFISPKQRIQKLK
jgi:hypothetical protein